jgi:hypothetical protein
VKAIPTLARRPADDSLRRDDKRRDALRAARSRGMTRKKVDPSAHPEHARSARLSTIVSTIDATMLATHPDVRNLMGIAGSPDKWSGAPATHRMCRGRVRSAAAVTPGPSGHPISVR